MGVKDRRLLGESGWTLSVGIRCGLRRGSRHMGSGHDMRKADPKASCTVVPQVDTVKQSGSQEAWNSRCHRHRRHQCTEERFLFARRNDLYIELT